MCIGIPMQIKQAGDGYAICEVNGETRCIDTMLVGAQPHGTWLLTFLDTAREVISAEQAQQIGDALQAVELTLQGAHDIDHLFKDLIGREPELPEFLRTAAEPKDDDGDQL